ncbi:hypothetical protein H632_c2174p0, partial [Helicosporidium sp. ATCC 50920]
MVDSEQPPPPAVWPASSHGFELVRSEYVSESSSHVALYRHLASGAELMSVRNADENKTFGVTFCTPVHDSKGTPHILEHSVLCGSDRYPCKEPFVELMKGSLNTFLNAFTYPDRTCYPVASTNLRDYYNLVDVYLDAVFAPRARHDPDVLAQEGWHHDLARPEGPLKIKGVVYNEMKGVYSSPDAVNARSITQELFPDTTYHHDSGGQPSAISQLSFEEFRAFYSKHYHARNARLWFSGDDPAERRLEIADAYLSRFAAADGERLSVEAQPLWTRPRAVELPYAASA